VRVSNLRKRLDDVKKTLPDPLSPIPSPTLDAPSPAESPADENVDNVETVDMEMSSSDNDGWWPLTKVPVIHNNNNNNNNTEVYSHNMQYSKPKKD